MLKALYALLCIGALALASTITGSWFGGFLLVAAVVLVGFILFRALRAVFGAIIRLAAKLERVHLFVFFIGAVVLPIAISVAGVPAGIFITAMLVLWVRGVVNMFRPE